MTRLRWIGLAGVAAAALLLAAPLAARSGAVPAGNLIQNPGFEAGASSVDDNTVLPAAWKTSGKPSVWIYVAVATDRPDKDVAAKIGGGANFLSGGQPASALGSGPATATASQAIDVSSAAAEIDAGGVAANLSAFLGGYSAQQDTARVDARFLSAGGAALSSVRIGPVTREQRNNQTTLLKRAAQAAMPKGTRSIDVVITMSSPDSNTKVHGFADNISLTLGRPSTMAKPTLTVKCSGKTLVATVKTAVVQNVKRVTFSTSGRKVIDTKAPFTARFPTKELPAQIVVKARVAGDGPAQTLSKKIKRC